MHHYALFPRTPGLFSSLNVQKNMLQDRRRNEKFKEAIFKTVKKGDVVIDLGTGTGILAIWAAQAGAKRVFAIEETDVAEAAEAVVRENGFGEVITVIRANSSEVCLPERADVLVGEVVGHFLFEEGIVEAIAGARDALLKPQAKIIPSAARVSLAPVELGDAFTEISYWDTWEDPRLTSIRGRAANSAYVETVHPSNVLADPALLFDVNFTSAQPGALKAEAVFKVTRPGVIDGLAGWFELQLGPDIRLGTGPWDEPTHWQQCVFPLQSPFPVGGGDTVSCSFSVEPFAPGCEWHWTLAGGTDGLRREEHSLSVTYGQDARLLKERF